MYALTNVRLYDFKKFMDNAYIIFDEKIIEVGDMKDFKENDNYEIIDGKNRFVLPGFVSAHTHFYSAFARGLALPFNPKNFKDILEQLWWKIDHFLDKDMIYYSALMGGYEQLLSGTTTVIDHHASHQVKDSLATISDALKNHLGMRGIYCFETSDRFDVEEAINENMNFINTHKNHFESGLFGLHASLSLSDKTLKAVSEKLNNNGIHIHVGESIQDEEDSLEKYNKRVVKRLDDFNLINENSILVHTTHVDEDEMKIIKARNATIAVNVSSNMNNAVGIANVRKMLDLGIKVMIGNDGLIQSMPMEYLNTYYLTHLREKSPTAFGLDDIKNMIIEGYNFVGKALDIKIGELSPGFEADLQMVPYKEYTELNEFNVFGHMFFGVFPGFKPSDVFINGKRLVKNYEFYLDLSDSFKKAKEKSSELWEILAKEGKNLKYKI